MKRLGGSKLLFIIIAALPFLLMVLVYLSGRTYLSPHEQKVERYPVGGFAETIVVASDSDYEPFSFVDDNGNPSGYDIELLYALAEKMEVNIEFRLMNWADCKAAAANGEVDLITGLDYEKSGYPQITLSRALVNDSFVCFGKKKFNDIAELYHKKLATIDQSGSFAGFLEPYRLVENTTVYSTYTEAIQSVISDENDYAIALYPVGRRILAGLGETEVRAVGPSFINNSVCIGVSNQKLELLETLNDAIGELIYDGTVSALSDKWLGTYVELIGFRDFLRVYNHEIFIFVIALMILIEFAVFLIHISRTRTARAEQEKLLKEQELELTESRVAIMLSQIQPHFLFNTLTTISQLCRSDPETAGDTVVEFSHYLRGNLDSLALKRPIPFESELRHVKNYLVLEQKRFGDRIKVEYNIGTTGFMIPALTLQSVAENAIRYGITKKENGGTVTVTTTETDQSYLIIVADDGIGFDTEYREIANRTRADLENVKDRLASMCGGNLHIQNGSETVVTIEIPKIL